MPILLVAGVVGAAWLLMWRSGAGSMSPPTTQVLGRRLGAAMRAAARSWEQSARRRLTEAQARALLGVSEAATDVEVEAAYRRLMLRAHPDQGGTSALARQLTEARDVLIKLS